MNYHDLLPQINKIFYYKTHMNFPSDKELNEIFTNQYNVTDMTLPTY